MIRIQRRWQTFTLLAGIMINMPAHADEAAAQALLARHEALSAQFANSPMGAPLLIHSREQKDSLRAEVLAVVDYPFSRLKPALARASAWCQIIPLHPNVKSCTYQQAGNGKGITLYIGSKDFRMPDAAYQQHYRYEAELETTDYLLTTLTADKGPLGSRAYHMSFEAVPLGNKSLIRVHSSYEPRKLVRIITQTYLATAGRNKVGFSTDGLTPAGEPLYIKGIMGVIERNAMRYFLALKAYMETRQLPDTRRFEARISRWFELTEHYPQQLRELERDEYLDIKRRERQQQLNLQENYAAATLPGKA